MKLVKLKLSELVEDLSIYPRSTVYDGHVGELREAIKAGVELPPIIVDAKGKRIVDGFHRSRAYRREFGPDHVVECEVRKYKDEAALFLDAVRLNAHHGRRMSAFDAARVSTIASRLDIDPEMVASALSITVERLDEITVSKSATATGNELVPIRRGMSHLAGRRLTPAQESAARVVGGQTPIYHANQLIAILGSDSLDLTNARLIERLAQLRDLLTAKLPEPVAKE